MKWKRFEGCQGSLSQRVPKQNMVLDAHLNREFRENQENATISGNILSAESGEQGGSMPHVPIDVDSFDDDVLVSSPMDFEMAKNNSRRNRERAVIFDVDSEEWRLGFAPNSHNKRRRVPSGQTIMDCDLCVSLEGPSSMMGKRVERVELPPPLPPPPPKELTFSCPVCLGPIVEETSTRCGHIFCKACIKAAVAAQGKCPTCRKKMTMRSIIRVYLPTGR